MNMVIKRALTGVAAVMLAVGVSTAAVAHASGALAAGHRVVAYYQTQYDGSTYVSPTPLAGVATDVLVAAVHIQDDATIHLNDDPPDAAKFDPMWTDLKSLQDQGVKVEAMLGGAAQGSYANLANDFDTYYPPLKSLLSTYGFDGIDLDIEESFSLADTEHLITQLHNDFGAGFQVTLSPVASDLSGGSAFSGGFSYAQLEADEGDAISWYNAQFYNGWGSLDGTGDYEAIVNAGIPAAKVVAGALTNSANGGSGYVPIDSLTGTLSALSGEYSDFGGVAGWEYFNATGTGSSPADWYAAAGAAM
jgi:glycosyl hydrolase family 18 (putative chitinase)